ncbi:MAG: nucleotidyltransferase family protein [Paracoccaceae bacterium]|nr:nucleotidyltransferase family protein [Paracoccaceae bacterium]
MIGTVIPVQPVVLAGARAGGDPLCRSEGVVSKAVIRIADKPMLARVLTALAASRASLPAHVIGLDAATLALAADGIPSLPVMAKGQGPAASLLAALDGQIAPPLLVTTCDHALLTPAMIDNFLAQSIASGADLTVGLAERATIEAAYPETRRTYLRLGGAELSGCNLFYLATPQAASVLRFWQDAERDRKKPWRIAWRFGPLTALRILLARLIGRPGPDAVFALLSRALGVRVQPVILPFAEAAIDVDSPGDLTLVREILARRTAG